VTHNVFVGIDYETDYIACFIQGPGDFKKRFATGDAVADFRAAVEFGAKHARETGVAFMSLSSIDGFVFDVAGYRWTRDDLIERAPA
jgi:hypothetical protein